MESDLMRVVDVHDPAIDKEAMGAEALGEYMRTRDYALLKFLPGKEPMVFHVREISTYQMVRIVLKEPGIAGSSEFSPAQCIAAFQCGVVSVDNLRQSDGATIPGNATLSVIPNTTILADEALQRFDLEVVLEVGSVAATRGFLARTTEREYRMPALCLGR